MDEGIHERKEKIYCNRCNKWLDKWMETITFGEEVHCLFCDLWLAGKDDTFGRQED